MVANPSRAGARIRNEEGMATIETIPLLFLFVFLFAYTMGGFGIVHTGIKNSIAARAYAFETFRNRSNLIYFRDMPRPIYYHYAANGARAHAIQSEEIKESDLKYVATERPLRVGMPSAIKDLKNADRSSASTENHNEAIFGRSGIAPGKRNENNPKLEVNPVWVMIQYGMCLNVRCGDI